MAAIKQAVALPYLGPQGIARLAKLAEDSGWDGVFVGDAIWCQDPMIGLAAAALATRRIRLGTMITPAPLRKPWKLASESLALDELSAGRLTLGLGAGAVWMGWQAFPCEPTDARTRAELLDETIDILDGLYRRKPFDYHGKHYQVRLTELDPQFYPPAPLQQPRIPLWVVGIWPKPKSMRRALRCDGLIVQVMSPAGEITPATPEDLQAVSAYTAGQRAASGPFDIVVEGSRTGLTDSEHRKRLEAFAVAGATWWVEGMWAYDEDLAAETIMKGAAAIE